MASEDTGQSSGKLRADAESNRDAILAAAAHLYATREPLVPNVDVAREAGVGRATLARRFPTPEALRLGVLERLVEQIEERAARLPAAPGALELLLEGVLELFDENVALVDLVRSRGTSPTGSATLLDRVRAVIAPPLAAAREAGLVDPSVDAEDVRLLVFMASSAIRSDPGARTRERVLTLLERSLRPSAT